MKYPDILITLIMQILGTSGQGNYIEKDLAYSFNM